MELKTIQSANVINHIALIGRLDANGVQAIESQTIDALILKPKPAIIDMSQVDFLSSIGIRMLVRLAKALQTQDLRMALLKPHSLVAKSLELAKLDSLFIITEDEAEAIDALTR